VTQDRFAQRLAYYHAEINEIHAFREGNGRAHELFLCQLALDAGYGLGWTAVEAEENINAAAVTHKGDLGPMARILSDITKAARG
jgi:fido (protein-threonine AMPylation protein)